MAERGGLLLEGSPLISAARLGKLRLVRLLVEGGAQVDERSPRGETPLLAACRALRASPSAAMLRVIQCLLSHGADPNIQDRTGRTALMYACMERAGAEVAAALIAAGADASMQDHSGASALVYAVNGQDRDTLALLLDACRARGRHILIIATDLSCDSSRSLNVPPSPDASPVSCMSPSDIELKTNSPNSDGENFFSFRADGSPGLPRGRVRSEPWLAVQNLPQLSQTYEKSLEDEGKEGKEGEHSLIPSEETDLSLRAGARGGSRRNTLPDLLQPPALRLSDTHLHRTAPRPRSIYRTSSMFLAPPDGLHDGVGEQWRCPARSGFLPPLPIRSGGNVWPIPAAVSPSRRPSAQLEEMPHRP